MFAARGRRGGAQCCWVHPFYIFWNRCSVLHQQQRFWSLLLLLLLLLLHVFEFITIKHSFRKHCSNISFTNIRNV
jgi:hypothetical protein